MLWFIVVMLFSGAAATGTGALLLYSFNYCVSKYLLISFEWFSVALLPKLPPAVPNTFETSLG